MAEINQKSNARRFLDAYNNIDYALKTRYNINRSTGFSDLVRKACCYQLCSAKVSR